MLKRQGNMVLVQHRDNKPNIGHPGKYCFPGGSLETGEDPQDAAVRELREETGLLMEPSQLEFLCNIKEGSEQVFTCFVSSDTKVQSLEGRMEWHAIEELTALDFVPGEEALFPKLREKFCQ